MISGVEGIPDGQLRQISRMIGEAFVTNELFRNWGTPAERHTGSVSFPQIENMKLSNTAAILIRSIPDEAEIIDG